MMRCLTAWMGLLGACLTLGFAASAIGASQGARPPRGWRITLSPTPGDLSLVEIAFPHAGRQSLSTRTLQTAAGSPFGADYLAVAVPRRPSRGHQLALMLLANRPSALLDPASVRLRISAGHSLGPPVLQRVTDPLTHPSAHPARALCGLTAHGRPLSGPSLRALSVRGAALVGFDAPDAVAQAYDAACGLTYSGAFRAALAGSAGGCSGGVPCAPAPAPPSPRPPRCAPCDPRPGFACPLAASPAVCGGPAPVASRSARTSAH